MGTLLPPKSTSGRERMAYKADIALQRLRGISDAHRTLFGYNPGWYRDLHSLLWEIRKELRDTEDLEEQTYPHQRVLGPKSGPHPGY